MQVPEIQETNDFLHGTKDVVSIETALSQNTVFIDIRTPKEFNETAIIGAINRPLFDDGERAQIGTIYKQISQDAAIQLGKKLLDSRLAKFVEGFLPFKEQLITIYCARGGMRSTSVVCLLTSLGFHVQQLIGGYKSYRKHVLQSLEKLCPPPLIVIHGQTGVGKTRLLKKLPHSIDLEGLAQHRSSLFGAVNKQPRSQKAFEAYLHSEFCNFPAKQSIFIEGESRKIGDVFIPNVLFDAMKQGTIVLLTAAPETRIERIIEDYVFDDEKTYEQLNCALQSLRMALGNRKVDWLCQCLKKSDFYTIVRTLLSEYYDPRYQHSMKNYTYALKVSADNLDEAAQKLLTFQKDSKPSLP